MSEWCTYGRQLRLSLHGQSHADALEFKLENFPEGFRIDTENLAEFMERRAPGRDSLSSSRMEPDKIEFVSGVNGYVTDGTTIAGRIANKDVRAADYGAERTVPRPGHADFGQWVRYGRIPTGGGMNSGRLTALLCAAGGICKQYLERRGIVISARIACVHGKTSDIDREIAGARDEGDSVGGTILCEATGLTPGLGGALFNGVETELSGALFAIPGVNGVEFGNGFAAAQLKGSENDDPFRIENGAVVTSGNHHGGILGGRTSGMPLVFKVSMKPTPTVFRPLPSVDLATMSNSVIEMKGRHDPCIARRAVPVVEAVAAFVLADMILADEAVRPRICLTLTGHTLDEDFKQYSSQRYFTDMVELRVDLLDAAERGRVVDFPEMVNVPVILTFRRKCDGGAFDGPESVRVDFFREVLTRDDLSRNGLSAGHLARAFAYVDFEDDFRNADLSDLAEKAGIKIIRSLHDFSGPVYDIANRCRALRGKTSEIPKIAFKPGGLGDVERLFRETSGFTDIPHITLAMGATGIASRILASRTHSMLTFASVSGLKELGHMTPAELVKTYRFREPNASRTLTGVTGFPLMYTRSPELHNGAYFACDEDILMVPVPAEDVGEAMSFMKGLSLKGMAVTIPHKQSVKAFLDRVSPEAAEIGAVNTVSCEQGKYVGYNTDAEGFEVAIKAFAGLDDFHGVRVAVLGAGGASKAVVFALKKLGADIRVYHRQALDKGFDLIVNATPVDPIPEYVFDGSESVYDLRYSPEMTTLLERAKAAGCRTENGMSMLKAQAEAQRRIWRGK